MQPLADALDDLLEQRRVVLGHGHVVEEEQRLGAAADGVVDAHRHQVDADRVVPPGQLGHLQLACPRRRCRRPDRVLIVAGEQPAGEIELEQAGESTVRPALPAGVRVRCISARQPRHRLWRRPPDRRPEIFVSCISA